MEMNQLGLLEELLLSQSCTTITNGTTTTTTPGEVGYPSWNTTSFQFHDGRIITSQNFDNFDDTSNSSSFLGLINSSLISTTDQSSCITLPFCQQLGSSFFSNGDPDMGGSGFMEEYGLPPFPITRDQFEGMEEDGGLFVVNSNNNNNDLGCKVEGDEGISESLAGDDGGDMVCKGNSRMKKVGAQPSKNLMAERRRRKRLNDRLSMLRSIVPKISKMDRTAIVGDTIDYMKELLAKIEKLREDKHIITGNTSSCCFDDTILPANHSLLRNNPKFEVERREEDTRIGLCCNAKPGMLLSTLGTLETLGLDVQQCVISCFNDFSLQASCSEAVEHRGIITPEDIKQALFRNAGYGGRCL